jgi:hypothetical protein
LKWNQARSGVAVLGVLLAVVSVGCSSRSGSSTGPLRAVNHDGSKAAGGLHVKPGLPYEMPLRPVCTETGAPAKIDSVTPWNPKGDIRIVDWGVRISGPNHPPGGPEVGGQQMTVEQVGGFNHGPVTVKCSDNATVQEFYVCASTTHTRSSMDGVTIRYDRGKMIHVQFGIAFCLQDPNCDFDFS